MMCFGIRVNMYSLILQLAALITTSSSYQPTEKLICAKQCTCATAEHLSDMPMMKLLKVSIDTPTNTLVTDNSVLYNDEEVTLNDNPVINTAICLVSDRWSSIQRSEFSKPIEALTVLHGPDMQNKTIEHEFAEFHELLALDIQGYPRRPPSNDTCSQIFLHHNALLQQQRLRYLNIQFIRIFPNPNSTTKQIPAEAYNVPRHRLQNITFMLPGEPEVMPYHEYKQQKNIISTFAHLSGLQFLRLFRCQLDTLTWEMFDGLVSLRTLSLEGNDLVELPEYAFYGMPELRELVLADNKLARIHNDSLAGLFKLESLDLSNNRLTRLSDSTFAPLPRLQRFNLFGNPIRTISSNTFEVTRTTAQLKIGSTESLTVYANAFNGLSWLEKLDLFGLNASELHKESLTGMPNLRHLRVAGYVEYVAFDTFAGSPLLEELVLRNCSIAAVSEDAFFGLRLLRRLDLSRNQLKTLSPAVFDQLGSLRELILSHNRLVAVPAAVFQRLQHVAMIRLEDNPWHCSCEMTNWTSLSLNKIKIKKKVDRCSYQYDKSPCVTVEENAYVHNSHVMPKCSTPAEYNDKNAMLVVTRELQCTNGPKLLSKEWARFLKKGRRTVAKIHTAEIRTTEADGKVEWKTEATRDEVSTIRESRPSEGSLATEAGQAAKWTTERAGGRDGKLTRVNPPNEGIRVTEVGEKHEQTNGNGQENDDVDNAIGDLSQFLDHVDTFGPRYRGHDDNFRH